MNNGFIGLAIRRYKATLFIFAMIIMGGIYSYTSMTKEAEPNVPIPMITVDVSYHGMSPEDSEKRLVKPLEKEIKNLEGLKEVESTAYESGAHILIEFQAGQDRSEAFTNVRDAVNQAKQNLPDDIEEPELQELSYSDRQPILNVAVYGDAPEQNIIRLSRKLQDKIEMLKGVNRIEMTGDRDEQVELIISPEKIKNYELDQEEVISIVSANNKLAPVGTLSSKAGKYTFNMPGTINDIQDIYTMPVKVVDDKVITFEDIAKIRRVHEDPSTKAFFNGEPAVGMSVIKSNGGNVIETVQQIDQLIKRFKKEYPSTINVTYSEDESVRVKTMINGLENSILSSIVLVLIVIIAALGVRSALLVGIAIPGAFLMGMIALSLMGVTINIIVLFALIMSVGMLVDGAIVVTEYADMKLAEGATKFQAYMESVERMAWPIIASTITTLIAFIPLMFWPGLTGEFMKYLPITIVCILTSSLFMALIFVPTIGALIGKRRSLSQKSEENVKNIENGEFDKIRGIEGIYYKILKGAVYSPVVSIAFVCFLSFTIVSTYVASEPKTLFFPEVEQRGANVLVRSKSDLSIHEKEERVKELENIIRKDDQLMDNVKSIYTEVSVDRDIIGDIRLRYDDWQTRKKGALITQNLREQLQGVGGVLVEIKEEKGGPSKGKKLQINLNGSNKEDLYSNIEPLMQELKKLPYLIELEDNRPVNGMQWNIEVDREKAAKYGASVFTISNYIQIITHGLTLGDYRPKDLEESIDIKIRYPENMRTLNSLSELLIKTDKGVVPAEYFITKEAVPKIEAITRVDNTEVIQIGANTIEGVGINEKLGEIKSVIDDVIGDNDSLWVDFKGDIERQKEAADFLSEAFIIVILMMYTVLIIQFNKYHQGLIILSSVVFATIGCLLLLYVTNEPFGIVMGGIGIIALSGIVVNNNIVLIDTFNYKTDVEKKEPFNAIIETGVQRLRPVLLTTITTVLGLVPMAMQLNINLFEGDLVWNSPASYWWAPLSMMVIGGLLFSTIITLFLTPCLLIFLQKEYWIVKQVKKGVNYFKNPS